MLLLLLSACGRQHEITSPTPEAGASTFSLSGHVADMAAPAKAIAAATVSIGDGPNTGRSTTTDEAGNYRFADLQRSGFTVTVSAENYSAQSLGINLVSNQTLSFALRRSTSTVPPTTFDMTGTALDDEGRPAANATVYLDFLASDVPGTYFAHASAATDATGVYRLVFDAVPGLMSHDMTAFACLRTRPDYASDCQWIRATSRYVSQNFRTYRFKQLVAGNSIAVTVLPSDSVCLNGVQDSPGLGQDFVCRGVRIVAPEDGVMTIEAQSVEGTRPPLEVEVVSAAEPCCAERIGNPTSLSVSKGTVVAANVEIPWGSLASQSFILNTTLEQR